MMKRGTRMTGIRDWTGVMGLTESGSTICQGARPRRCGMRAGGTWDFVKMRSSIRLDGSPHDVRDLMGMEIVLR